MVNLDKSFKRINKGRSKPPLIVIFHPIPYIRHFQNTLCSCNVFQLQYQEPRYMLLPL